MVGGSVTASEVCNVKAASGSHCWFWAWAGYTDVSSRNNSGQTSVGVHGGEGGGPLWERAKILKIQISVLGAIFRVFYHYAHVSLHRWAYAQYLQCHFQASLLGLRNNPFLPPSCSHIQQLLTEFTDRDQYQIPVECSGKL